MMRNRDTARRWLLAWALGGAYGAMAANGADGYLLELEPEPRGNRGALELHGWLSGPASLDGLDFKLAYDPARVDRITVRMPDRYKTAGLVAEATATAGGADVRVRYAAGEEHRPAAGERSLALSVHICFVTPTPIGGWDFPLGVSDLQIIDASAAQPPAGSATVPPIVIPWGINHDNPPCRNEPQPPDHFRCTTQPDGKVLLTWENPQLYTAIHIGYGRHREAHLPGDATSWVHEEGGAANNYIYEIQAFISDPETFEFSDVVTCAAADPRTLVPFVRGDANSDGLLSCADVITIGRWLFSGEGTVECIDAADVDDTGVLGLTDQFAVLHYLFGMPFGSNGKPFEGGAQPPAPFPAPGIDPTHEGEEQYMSCDSYSIIPPVATDDAIRIGDVEAAPGQDVLVPVYLTNSQPIHAFQLVVAYDASILRIESGAAALELEGTFYEPFVGQSFTYTRPNSSGFFTYGGPLRHLDARPEEGVFTAGSVSHPVFSEMFEVPPGADTVIARIRVAVSPDVPPGTLIHLDPTNGPDGGGYGPFRIHNELTYQGDGRLATLLPRQVGGILRVGVDGDISFFIRGDANGDANVDISDAVTVLGFLFLGAAEPRCFDAADADDSGDLLITDAIAILTQLFGGAASIQAPYPEAGGDPQPDFLPACKKE